MTIEISLDREVVLSRRCTHSVVHDTNPRSVVDSRRDTMSAAAVLESVSDSATAQRAILQPNERTCARSTNSNVRFRRLAFGPQHSVARYHNATRILCTKPYFLVTRDTPLGPEEDHGIVRNKSHSRHVSATGLALDHGYTAVSIGDRLIDRAFVYCKNLRCKG
jgi:hypothetical protein